MREHGRRRRALVGRADGLGAHVAHHRVPELLVRRAELERVDDAAEALGVVGVRAAEQDGAAVLVQERLEVVLRRELLEAVDELVERPDGRVDLGGQGELLVVGRRAGPGRADEGALAVNREGREQRRSDHGRRGEVVEDARRWRERRAGSG